MTTTNTLIPTLDASGSVPAYVVRPTGAPRGAIIVVQEIFGVNPGIRKKAEDWADAGYLAVAPDIFWRQQPSLDFNPDVPEEFQQAVGYMMKHDFARGLEDLKAVLAWARDGRPRLERPVPGDHKLAGHHTQDGGPTLIRVGLVGFCMGGKIAYEAASGTDIEAAVGYYGVGIDQMLESASAITGQLLLHIPTSDGFVPAASQAAMHAGLEGNPHVTLHDYVGLDHGFADTFGARRNEAGAKLADQRTAEFFAKYVG